MKTLSLCPLLAVAASVCLHSAIPVAHFELNESSGSVAASSAGQDGIISGTLLYREDGLIDSSIGFDGGDVITLGTNGDVQPSGDFTATLWVQANEGTSDNTQILGAADGIANTSNGWILKP